MQGMCLYSYRDGPGGTRALEPEKTIHGDILSNSVFNLILTKNGQMHTQKLNASSLCAVIRNLISVNYYVTSNRSKLLLFSKKSDFDKLWNHDSSVKCANDEMYDQHSKRAYNNVSWLHNRFAWIRNCV